MATIIRIATKTTSVEKPLYISLPESREILFDAIKGSIKPEYPGLKFRLYKNIECFLYDTKFNEEFLPLSDYNEFKNTFLPSLEGYFHTIEEHTVHVPNDKCVYPSIFMPYKEHFHKWFSDPYAFIKLNDTSNESLSMYYALLAELDKENIRYQKCRNYTIGFMYPYYVDDDWNIMKKEYDRVVEKTVVEINIK